MVQIIPLILGRQFCRRLDRKQRLTLPSGQRPTMRSKAMASPNPLPALQALKASKAGFNFRVGNKVQNWFDFINGKAHVLSVLDGSGVFSWPGGSLLDVGCGHGFLDAFVMGRYVKVVGIELAGHTSAPRSWLHH
jgi:2-polyprenyl-3-methyl-5-hydroxy-6-metoxy-1,4-benzoquinol methylase